MHGSILVYIRLYYLTSNSYNKEDDKKACSPGVFLIQSLKNSVAAIFTSEATYLAQVICLRS